MRLNPRLMRDTLTVQRSAPAQPSPLSPRSSGPPTVSTVLEQPCSDQDIPLSKRKGGEIVEGQNGSLPVSQAYTQAFTLPDLAPGESFIYLVNGRTRPLLRQGPPNDIGGQHALWLLELGPPG